MGAETLQSEMREASELFERFLAGFFRQHAERYAYGRLFEPIYAELADYVLRRGKRIRPLLFLASYRLFGGTRPDADPSLLRAAAAIELFHSFILIHDDVIDRSERRRGLPTFHKRMEGRLGLLPDRARLGQNLAIVAGDMLHALALETLLATDFAPAARDAALRRFLGYVGDTGCGETLDILFGARDIARVDREEISQMYNLKTTRYTFEAPLVLGALFAGAPEEVLHDLARVAEPVGLAFQIQNDLIEHSHFDLLDVALQTDLLEGKKTLLLRLAYERLHEVDRSFLRLCLSAPPRDSTVQKIRELVDKSRAAEMLAARREELLQQAREILAASVLDGGQQARFQEMIGFMGQTVRGGN